MVLGVSEGYKYFGITEDYKSEVIRETYNKDHKEILSQVENIFKIGLDGRNNIAAINEYALLVIN